MIDTGRLLADLTRLRSDLEDDLRGRCGERPDLEASLQQEYRRAVGRERTADIYDSWREECLTQVAVAWILGCVFVRFLEDNALVDPPRLSGPGDRRTRALDEHNLYFRAHPTDTDREYLLQVFRAVAALPVAGQLFDERHNPLWSVDAEMLSGDAATRLLRLWQRIDPDSGALAHDFTDRAWDTRFLGDLYQDLTESIGITSFTLEDDIYLLSVDAVRRRALPADQIREMVAGETIRDWGRQTREYAAFPYDNDFQPISDDLDHPVLKYLWPARSNLANNRMFGGKTKIQTGLEWYEYGRLTREKLRTPLSITFADVATQNHFVLDRGGRVFKRTAPVIKLAAETDEDQHLGLLGQLNSSTACFWMKQVFHNKGGGGIGGGLASERWEQFHAFDATKLREFPVQNVRSLNLARELDALAQKLIRTLPAALVAAGPQSAAFLQAARTRALEIRQQMVALQEELDWCCYRHYGVTEDELCIASEHAPAIRLGERAFEIVLARRIAAGEVETKWFERHGSTATTEIPTHWPPTYQELVRRRIRAIEKNANIALIEQPEYKRRWNDEPWETQQERALRGWLLDRLEAPSLWSELRLTTTAALADRMREDAEFLQVAELHTGRPDFDVAKLVAGLVEEQSVPLLSVLRYKPSGLRKREAWERTWDLQRREDAVDARTKLPSADPEHLTPEQAATLKATEIGTIPVPPRYASADFRKAVWWRLRGKLDVPKERFVSLPYCEREADPSLVIGWAGWNALEQSRAVAAYFHQMREQEGWTVERLTPLLAVLLDLLPWVRQYHNAPDAEFDTGMGDYFEGFIDEEARALSLTHEAVRAWAPPAGRARRGDRRRSSNSGA